MVPRAGYGTACLWLSFTVLTVLKKSLFCLLVLVVSCVWLWRLHTVIRNGECQRSGVGCFLCLVVEVAVLFADNTSVERDYKVSLVFYHL